MMRIAKSTGRFYPLSQTFGHLRLVLIGSIVGGTMLFAATSVAEPETTRLASTATNGNSQGALGESLLQNLLGGDAPRPQSPADTSQRTPNVRPPASGTAPQLAQGFTFPDIQGNWARSFIEVLAQRGIIRGFPDGTFRPNDPVTRAQFAAMIRQAFDQPFERGATQFVDIPPNYWAFEAIQEAYRMGFLQGYPNNVFLPEQNIPRVQVLVALANGLDLAPPANVATLLGRTYQDATQIPDFARPSVAAATLNQLVVNYPNVAFLNPNQAATRADVAAFIYQALVNEGALPQVSARDVAAQYIVGYEPIAEQPTGPTPEEVASLRQQYRLPQPPVVEQLRRIIRGGSSISTPTAFGAQSGNIFFGATYQERVRFSNQEDGAVVVGFGLGNAQQIVGFETAITAYDLLGDTFEDGGISFKVHRQFPGNLAVAIGVENAITWGSPDGGSSVYGVVSKVFPLREDTSQPLSEVTASLGLGGGRFRSEDDIEQGKGSTNVFGSIGVRVAEPVNLIAEWTGQDLNLGASIRPIPGVPLVITPAAADVTGSAGDGTRFIIGVGYGITF